MEGFSAGELVEVPLLELGLGDLSALTGGAGGVSVLQSGVLHHVQPKSLELVIRGDDLGRSEGSGRVVEGVGVLVEPKTVGQGLAGDGVVELLAVLLGLVPGVVHDVSPVGDLAADGHANLLVDVVQSPVGALHEQSGEDQLLGSEDDAINALNSHNGPEWYEMYSAPSTALAAYSNCNILPSSLYVLQSRSKLLIIQKYFK